jgi:hypothetical protein
LRLSVLWDLSCFCFPMGLLEELGVPIFFAIYAIFRGYFSWLIRY